MKKKLFLYTEKNTKRIGNLHFVNKYGFLDLFQNAAKKKKKKRKKPTKNARHKNLKVCFILFDPFLPIMLLFVC